MIRCFREGYFVGSSQSKGDKQLHRGSRSVISMSRAVAIYAKHKPETIFSGKSRQTDLEEQSR
jgi:hypothetical protein